MSNFKWFGIICCMLLILNSCIPCLGQKANTSPSAPPNTCHIQAKIIKLLPAEGNEAKLPCSRYPCKAQVYIIHNFGCGSSISVPLVENDTVVMSFVYTLHATKHIFPAMKVQYPGLKKGSIFFADAEQRIAPTGKCQYMVYDYQVK